MDIPHASTPIGYPPMLSPSPVAPGKLPGVAMSMMLHNFNILNGKVEQMSVELGTRSGELDMLDQVMSKFESFEKTLREMKTEIEIVKETVRRQGATLEMEENHHHDIENRVLELENQNHTIEQENINLKEDFLKLQAHSMKYNLIFNGIEDNEGENTEVEIANRRSALLPKMRDLLKRSGERVKLVYDTLYVNGVPYRPQHEQELNDNDDEDDDDEDDDGDDADDDDNLNREITLDEVNKSIKELKSDEFWA
ncbi:clusterin-associated protein 1-like [Mizuhopecten yessoensis]|uniref:clusterin-associated protein 1-like n=1 Tax=Mizuhopecten yessoensis TaxID=6573 RepID=UPI000B45AD4B|nr:clusterin-associated protein 1-like [Mizuhopecten yessoensis]